MKLDKFVTLLLVLAVTFCAGCVGGGSEDLPEMGLVSGTVTMDGTPLANVSVTFTSTDGQASYGTTDADGKYELTFRGNIKGAKIGEHTVTIETPLEAPAGPGYKDPIPAKYNVKTTLTAIVKEGENPAIDFKLTKK